MITASKQLWLWLTAHGGLGRCRYLTSSSYCHKQCWSWQSSHFSVFLDFSPPSYLRRKEETWGEKESRLLTRWDKWRWIQLNVPQYPSIVDVSLSDVERTAAYEELRKQWRAESLIAHLTVFKDKHGLWTQRKRVQSCSCRGLNISSECRACFTQRMHHRSQLLLLHLSPHAYKVNTTFTKCFCVILPALLIRLKHNI